jgi:hypothetical protein
MTDAVRVGTPDGVGDLTSDGHHDEVAVVDTGGLISSR